MKIGVQRRALSGAVLALAVILCGSMAGTMKIADAADKTINGQAACVTCHEFDKLASMKPAFKASSGEIVNPHRYVPHNEKKVENVPDCTNCHTPHPIPPMEKIDLSKINVENCFLSCHHQQNFEPCEDCHKH